MGWEGVDTVLWWCAAAEREGGGVDRGEDEICPGKSVAQPVTQEGRGPAGSRIGRSESGLARFARATRPVFYECGQGMQRRVWRS